MFSFSKKDNFIIVALEPSFATLLADLHKAVFPHAWGAESFASLLNDERVFGFVAHKIGRPQKIIGFIIARLVCDEAEIITIAVDRNYRRCGVGKLLIDALLQSLYRARAAVLFLEVDENNRAAINLYKSFNFSEFGRRAGYYLDENGRSDALMMRRDFR